VTFFRLSFMMALLISFYNIYFRDDKEKLKLNVERALKEV